MFCTRYCFTDSKYDGSIEREISPAVLNSGHDSEVRTTIIQLWRPNPPERSSLTGCNIYPMIDRYTSRTLHSYEKATFCLSRQSTHISLDRQPWCLINFSSARIVFDVTTICGPIHSCSMIETSGTSWLVHTRTTVIPQQHVIDQASKYQVDVTDIDNDTSTMLLGPS